MQNLDFERKIPAPDEIHSGMLFNEYTPEGRECSTKDIVLGTVAAIILLLAYCAAGYLEMAV